MYLSTSQHPNLFDYPNSATCYQSNFVHQSPESSSSSFKQLNLATIESTNNVKNSAIDESKQERKKRQNRAAAQRAREKEKNLLIALQDENERLKVVYERKVEEMKKLTSI